MTRAERAFDRRRELVDLAREAIHEVTAIVHAAARSLRERGRLVGLAEVM